jgi:hypothetical protein
MLGPSFSGFDPKRTLRAAARSTSHGEVVTVKMSGCGRLHVSVSAHSLPPSSETTPYNQVFPAP